jgi:hypothetical protein
MTPPGAGNTRGDPAERAALTILLQEFAGVIYLTPKPAIKALTFLGGASSSYVALSVRMALSVILVGYPRFL